MTTGVLIIDCWAPANEVQIASAAAIMRIAFTLIPPTRDLARCCVSLNRTGDREPTLVQSHAHDSLSRWPAHAAGAWRQARCAGDLAARLRLQRRRSHQPRAVLGQDAAGRCFRVAERH